MLQHPAVLVRADDEELVLAVVFLRHPSDGVVPGVVNVGSVDPVFEGRISDSTDEDAWSCGQGGPASDRLTSRQREGEGSVWGG